MTRWLKVRWVGVCAPILLSLAAHAGAVTWESEAAQFRYAVENNGGTFVHLPTLYLNFNDVSSVKSYDPSAGELDNLSDQAVSTLIEFGTPPGEIQLGAGAMGPLSNQSPADGIRVQAFAEILPSGLGTGHGVQVSQKVVSFVNRRFTVPADGNYPIGAVLNGAVLFGSFDNGSKYRAAYSLAGTGVMLEEIVQLNPSEIQILPLPGFPLPLDDAVRSQGVTVALKTNRTYQLRGLLSLQSNLVNYDFQSGSVIGPITGPYRLGSQSAPLILDVFVSIDTDGDGVPDTTDAFPNDPTEWFDTDGDGIGNNADLDDDNDGMPDAWEIAHQLNPLVNDADLDKDGDGFTNFQEYMAGSNPNDPKSFPQRSEKSMPWLQLLLEE